MLACAWREIRQAGLTGTLTCSGAPNSNTAYYGDLALRVNETFSYTLADGSGSDPPAVATDGSVSATELYDPNGPVRYQSGNLPIGEGYTGQRGTPSKPR